MALGDRPGTLGDLPGALVDRPWALGDQSGAWWSLKNKTCVFEKQNIVFQKIEQTII